MPARYPLPSVSSSPRHPTVDRIDPRSRRREQRMRAVVYDQFGATPRLRQLPPPDCPPAGAVIRVEATGVCRSDWHGWMGHDPTIALPQVPGHEFAGVVEQVGADVRNWRSGARVTVPFVCGCGSCRQCLDGDQQVCANQTQPGFTAAGSFAELVAIDHADVNLVELPAELDFVAAAALGCRFATAYRAVVQQGGVRAGQWVAVHGCGGVGLSAVMIAVATGARVVGIDVCAHARELATQFGATAVLQPPAAAAIRELTVGGAHLSIEAIGQPAVFADSVSCLRPRGRHVQVGLLLADDSEPRLDMSSVISRELEIVGSHGMAAHSYPNMLAQIAAGTLQPARLVGRTVALEDAPQALTQLSQPGSAGTTVVLPQR